MGLNIAFFGSSLVSSYWNGAATYYRGIIKALHARGHRVTFYEPDAYERQQHRDMADPPWARVVVYDARDDSGALRSLEAARTADVIVKASGVGVFDELLERAVLEHKTQRTQVVFWDVDAPATLERMLHDPDDPFRGCVSQYDAILTYGGGTPVIEAYEAFGARSCSPIYNALDPDEHQRVAPDPRFAGALGFMASRLPDREQRVEEFFFEAANRLPSETFVLGGTGWSERALPANVRAVGHIYTRDHNAFNASSRAILNVNRDSMARFGFSPPTRIFEAAGAAACIITDRWNGIDMFLEPDAEILVADGGGDVAGCLAGLTERHAREIGEAARKRVLAHHTYAQRASRVEAIFTGSRVRPAAADADAERRVSL
jgi:spore maturation protein CgeB